MSTGIIIKASRDEDFYVGWSRIASGPLFWGTREEMAIMCFEETATVADTKSEPRSAEVRGDIEKRLARADEHGSSDMIGNGRWTDEVLIYEDRNHNGLVPRARLKEFVKSMEVEGADDADGDPDYSILIEMDQ